MAGSPFNVIVDKYLKVFSKLLGGVKLEHICLFLKVAFVIFESPRHQFYKEVLTLY